MEKDLDFDAVVYLKSGGPAMTINGEGSNGWLCQWFVGDDLMEREFQYTQLTNDKPKATKTPTKKATKK